MTKIWVLTATSGERSDRHDWNVRAYADEPTGQAECDRLNAAERQRVTDYEQQLAAWFAKSEKLKAKFGEFPWNQAQCDEWDARLEDYPDSPDRQIFYGLDELEIV